MSIAVYEPAPEKMVHNTSVDFVLRYIGEVVHVVQYDDGLPILAVALYRNGKPYTVSAEEVSIRYGKPDGTFVYNSALGKNETGTVVYFAVTQQMTSVPGKARMTVEVVDGGTACSGIVMMEVERNPVQEGAIESSDEFQALGQRVEEEVGKETQAVRAEMLDVLATKQDCFVSRIDLSGSAYDQSTYYPVTGTPIPKGGLHKIHAYTTFDMDAHPTWATNAAGYTCNMEIYDKAQSGGQADGAAICTDYSSKHTSQLPCGYLQMPHSSTPVVPLLGGGVYYIETDYAAEWTVRTDVYTYEGDTIRPGTKRTLKFDRATIFADLNGNVTGKVNGYTLGKTVPSNAVFTDTVYTHPSTAGNKHIPSGGSAGQILRWSANGTAVWGDEAAPLLVMREFIANIPSGSIAGGETQTFEFSDFPAVQGYTPVAAIPEDYIILGYSELQLLSCKIVYEETSTLRVTVRNAGNSLGGGEGFKLKILYSAG